MKWSWSEHKYEDEPQPFRDLRRDGAVIFRAYNHGEDGIDKRGFDAVPEMCEQLNARGAHEGPCDNIDEFGDVYGVCEKHFASVCGAETPAAQSGGQE